MTGPACVVRKERTGDDVTQQRIRCSTLHVVSGQKLVEGGTNRMEAQRETPGHTQKKGSWHTQTPGVWRRQTPGHIEKNAVGTLRHLESGEGRHLDT